MSDQQNNTIISRLFTAGAHFGFQKSRRHPSIVPFIFTNKQGTDILDLEKSAALLQDAQAFLKEAGAKGDQVLFVGTKSETTRLVEAAALRAEMPYVVNRWIGGVLTNFVEIKKRIERMKMLKTERDSGALERKYTKKELVVIGREVAKLEFNFSGIEKMERMPQVMVVVDPRHDAIAVKEARDMKIPVVAIMSSDCDVSLVTKPVVVNDALQSSVTLALDELVSAYLEGRATYTPAPVARFVRTTDTRPRMATTR